MSTVLDDVLDLERKARAKGLSMAAACRLVGMLGVTYSRWKSGKHSPMYSKYEALRRAIEQYQPEGR